jgi:hypothetical protein
MCGNDVSFLIDTGSPINVLDQTAWDSLSVKPKLKPCNTRFYGFTSNTPIEVVGQFSVRVYYIDRAVVADFIMVKVTQERLLSYKTARDLKIIIHKSLFYNNLVNSIQLAP